MSHISLPNGVTKLSIPPHSFHRMQPLDVTLYGPLKKAYNYECQLFMKVHPNEKLTPSDLPTLFSKAYGHVATVEKATKGFECTGIFPVNPNIFLKKCLLFQICLPNKTTMQIMKTTISYAWIKTTTTKK
jgi:hypothetical protein